MNERLTILLLDDPTLLWYARELALSDIVNLESRFDSLELDSVRE
jgi:hypothetical protein